MHVRQKSVGTGIGACLVSQYRLAYYNLKLRCTRVSTLRPSLYFCHGASHCRRLILCRLNETPDIWHNMSDLGTKAMKPGTKAKNIQTEPY